MAKRTIKRLNKTGRLSYEDALISARKVRAAMKKEGTLKVTRKVTNETTATGRGAIKFHVPPEYRDYGRSDSFRKTRRTAS
jgi:hypothetical protein